MLLVLWLAGIVCCYNNGVGKTPAMVSEDLILDTMNGIKKYGLDKVGYKYVNIDDCWQLVDRDKDGKVVPDPKRFPSGIPSLVNKVHQNGLNLGLYTDIGTETCQGRTGSYGHYEIDAKTYAEWQIDYIKVDFCHTTGEEFKEPWIFYSNFSKNINESTKGGRHILFSICNWGVDFPWKWAPKISNQWRTTGDIRPTFYSVLDNMEKTSVLYEYAGLYNYNDPDMLEVGVKRGTEELSMLENKAHFSLWSLMAAPLLLGNDLRNISSEILEIITNTEVIAINQDEKGVQGRIVKEEKKDFVFGACFPIKEGGCKWVQIWKKEMMEGKVAVGLFNHADSRESESKHFKDEIIEVSWVDLGLDPQKEYQLRDVWGHKDLGVFKEKFSSPSAVKQHDIFVFVMTPKNRV